MTKQKQFIRTLKEAHDRGAAFTHVPPNTMNYVWLTRFKGKHGICAKGFSHRGSFCVVFPDKILFLGVMSERLG